MLSRSTQGGETRTGYLVGGGIEWGVGGNWSAKFEYNFMHFDAVDRFVTFSAAFVPSPLVRDVETDLHLVKVGLNYRF